MLPREYRGVAFAVVIFLLVQLGALALVPGFYEGGYQAVDNPDDPVLSLVFLGLILVATALMLAAFKYNLDRVVRGFIVFVGGMLAWYVFSVLVPPLLALVPAALVILGLLFHPEWYVIDASGIVMGAGAAGLFGISFGLLPCILLLVTLAVYDAISVYGTEHMLSLAEGVMDLRIPVVLVIPLSVSYSILDDDFTGPSEADDEVNDAGSGDGFDDKSGEGSDYESNDNFAQTNGDTPSESSHTGTDAGAGTEIDVIPTNLDGRPENEMGRGGDDGISDNDRLSQDDEPDEEHEGPADEIDDRDAFFIGLGDAVMPAIMVASAAFFSPASSFDVPFLTVNLPALFAMGGTILGLLILLSWVMRGRPHAGLPLLNGGAIGGYLIGSIIAGVSLLDALGIAAFL